MQAAPETVFFSQE
jgi:hypothetical protein